MSQKTNPYLGEGNSSLLLLQAVVEFHLLLDHLVEGNSSLFLLQAAVEFHFSLDIPTLVKATVDFFSSRLL